MKNDTLWRIVKLASLSVFIFSLPLMGCNDFKEFSIASENSGCVPCPQECSWSAHCWQPV